TNGGKARGLSLPSGESIRADGGAEDGGALRGFLPPLDRTARCVLGRAGAADPLAATVSARARRQPSAVRTLVRRWTHEPLLQRGGSPSRRALRAARAGVDID